MTIPAFDPGRSAAIRDGLVDLASTARARRRRLRIGIGVIGVSALIAGAGVTTAAAGMLHWNPSIALPAATPGGTSTPPTGGNPGVVAPADVTPGSDIVQTIGTRIDMTPIVGDGTISFDPPTGATHVRVWFSCDTPGTTAAWGTGPGQDGFAAECGGGPTDVASYDFPLADGRIFTVQALAGVTSTVQYQYLRKTPTRWKVNAQGQTYGVERPGIGSPDLIAVTATNGRSGYVLGLDLAVASGDPDALGFKSPTDALEWQKEHQGKVQHINVYESDGTTVIGRFDIG